MTEKKLLLVGGGYADIPMIKAAKKLGYYVITTGNRPEEMGHKYSDEYIMADFSDKEAILAIAKEKKVSAICPSCNDFSALSCAYVAEKIGLKGFDSYETFETIHHKDKYRDFALKNEIRTPKAFGYENSQEAMGVIDKISFPLIVKPVDLTGGKGIAVARNTEELENSVKKAFSMSKVKRIVVEEYIEGSRHGFSAFLYKGEIVFYFMDNEQYYKNPYMVSGASTPISVDVGVGEKLKEESEKIAKILDLKDGIFHIQFIISKDEPVIIEICRRPPGDLYVKLVEYATGLDYPSFIVRAFIGEDCKEIEDVKSEQKNMIRHCIMADRNGVVKNVTFDQSIINNIIKDFSWWKSGDVITDFLVQKLGILFLKFDSTKEMLEKTEKLNKLINIEFGENI